MSTSKAPWADTPFALIPIPKADEDIKKASASVFIARDMACAHNGMIRGLNSIYQQCIHVTKPADIMDLLKYTHFWHDWIHEHHDGEERFFFPGLEKITGVTGLMGRNVEQHQTLEPGLHELRDFSTSTTADNYDGMKLRAIIDRLGPLLVQHLTEEIGTLLKLSKYDGLDLKKVYKEFEAQMRRADKYILPPLILGSMDNNYHGSANWPEIPGFLRVVVHYWFERKYQGVWRFSPSTTWGERRALIFVGNFNN